jgi:site-specific DNA recombinase
MKQAIAYIRVSTETQLDGFGLDAQTEAVTKFAGRSDLEIVEWFREEGVSGTKEAETREAWGRLELWLDDNHHVETVIIPSLDRLARDLMIQEAIIGNLRKRGITLISVREPDLCSDDPSRKLFRRMIGAISEYERELINMRLRAGRIAKAMSGNRASGQIPYGYRKEDDTTVKDEVELVIVRKCRELRQRGLSYQKIADWLNNNDYKPRNWTPETPEIKFHNSTVQKILKNPIYDGIIQLHDKGELVAQGVNESLKI